MHTNYVWLRGELIAVMKGSNLHFVKSDHIGRPYEARGTDGSVTWRAVGKAFDRAVTFDSIGGLNIGFPGQYFDSESGDWYNVHRYYDPTLGRYTQPDPTGMSDGLNRYSYVGANPVSRIDPDGRVALAIPFIPPIITGTNLAIGTAISLGAYAIDLMLSNSSRPPPGSVPISASPWSGDHGGIKGALGLGGRDSVFIDPEGNVWAEQPDGSWSNEGPASDYTGSGKASGRRGKDRDKRDCP
jgi:RHS repeat-associated protein